MLTASRGALWFTRQAGRFVMGAPLLNQRFDFCHVQIFVEVKIALQHRRSVTSRQAGDMFDREQAVRCRATVIAVITAVDVEQPQQIMVEAIGPLECSGQIGADLQPVRAFFLLGVHRIEARNRHHLRRVEFADGGHVQNGLVRDPAVLILGDVQHGHHR